MKNAKELILEKTFFLLLENGLEGISVSKVQKITGLSRGLLYRYFKNKSDLILEVCKRYFFERYFPFKGNLDEITLYDFINLSEKSAAKLFKLLEKNLGKKINILRYNMLYAEVIDKEPLFKSYAANEIKKMKIVLNNAIKNKEIKKLPNEFIENVFLDIMGRVTDISKDNNPKISDLFKDVKIFYKLLSLA